MAVPRYEYMCDQMRDYFSLCGHGGLRAAPSLSTLHQRQHLVCSTTVLV